MTEAEAHMANVRDAVRNALLDYESKNPRLTPEDRFLALLYVNGYRVIPVKLSGENS